MYEIKESGTEFEINKCPWKEYPYCPKTTVKISYDESGFDIHFTSYETDILAKRTEHNSDIHNDSCLEFFMQFDPENDNRYINIEVNPNGKAFNAVRSCRADAVMVDTEDIESLNIKTAVYSDRWELTYRLPVSYIQKYTPTYIHKKGNILKGNFYKCGDETVRPHFVCFGLVKTPEPDFHRSEYFCEFKLV